MPSIQNVRVPPPHAFGQEGDADSVGSRSQRSPGPDSSPRVHQGERDAFVEDAMPGLERSLSQPRVSQTSAANAVEIESLTPLAGHRANLEGKCALTGEGLTNPVIGPDGMTYEDGQIQEYLKRNKLKGPDNSFQLRFHSGGILGKTAAQAVIHFGACVGMVPGAMAGDSFLTPLLESADESVGHVRAEAMGWCTGALGGAFLGTGLALGMYHLATCRSLPTDEELKQLLPDNLGLKSKLAGEEVICPISMEEYQQFSFDEASASFPVTASDGHTYNYRQLCEMKKHHDENPTWDASGRRVPLTSPMDRSPLHSTVYVNRALISSEDCDKIAAVLLGGMISLPLSINFPGEALLRTWAEYEAAQERTPLPPMPSPSVRGDSPTPDSPRGGQPRGGGVLSPQGRASLVSSFSGGGDALSPGLEREVAALIELEEGRVHNPSEDSEAAEQSERQIEQSIRSAEELPAP